MEMEIAERVESLRDALEWTDEAYTLGNEVDCGWDDDDTHGWLRMGLVEVEWLRDPYGDGQEDWVAVNVSVDGRLFDADGYSHLADAVKDAAHTTAEWQHHCDGEIKDAVVEWLDDRYETYHLDGPQDEHDSWAVTWRDVSIQGYYDDDGEFVWSVSNGETGDCLDGSASSTPADVLATIEQIAADPMEETWLETIDDCLAEDEWIVRVSDDRLTVWRHDPSYAQSRRATYERVEFGEGRIELEYRLLSGTWRPFDERLPENEADVHAMAREAYEWVKAVSE